MVGRRKLLEELKIEKNDWTELAYACGINPKKTNLDDSEEERIRTAITLLEENQVSSYQQIAEYFGCEQNHNGRSPRDSMGESTVFKRLVEQAVNEGTITGDIYSQVFQEAAKRKFAQLVNTGEFQHNLSQGFHNILFDSGLTAEQMLEAGEKRINQILDRYEPQLISAPEPIKMIEGNSLTIDDEQESDLSAKADLWNVEINTSSEEPSSIDDDKITTVDSPDNLSANDEELEEGNNNTTSESDRLDLDHQSSESELKIVDEDDQSD